MDLLSLLFAIKLISINEINKKQLLCGVFFSGGGEKTHKEWRTIIGWDCMAMKILGGLWVLIKGQECDRKRN
jgi:hypothetical protein